MKRSCKISFSRIVEEAGLNRAARWMPLAFSFFMLGALIVAFWGCSVSLDELQAMDLPDCPLGFTYLTVLAIVLFFAGAEFVGSLFDLFFAWLRLRRCAK